MKRTGAVSLLLVGSVASGWVGCGRGEQDPAREPAVVFVCEHGAAKSVIAAALFNARAAARRLPFRADSSGLAPEPALLPAAVTGLRTDGLAPGRDVPLRVARDDLDRAAIVIAFDPLPADLTGRAPVTLWEAIPPVSVDYAAARDAM